MNYSNLFSDTELSTLRIKEMQQHLRNDMSQSATEEQRRKLEQLIGEIDMMNQNIIMKKMSVLFLIP